MSLDDKCLYSLVIALGKAVGRIYSTVAVVRDLCYLTTLGSLRWCVGHHWQWHSCLRHIRSNGTERKSG